MKHLMISLGLPFFLSSAVANVNLLTDSRGLGLKRGGSGGGYSGPGSGGSFSHDLPPIDFAAYNGFLGSANYHYASQESTITPTGGDFNGVANAEARLYGVVSATYELSFEVLENSVMDVAINISESGGNYGFSRWDLRNLDLTGLEARIWSGDVSNRFEPGSYAESFLLQPGTYSLSASATAYHGEYTTNLEWSIQTVPEPSATLLASGILFLLLFQRRRCSSI